MKRQLLALSLLILGLALPLAAWAQSTLTPPPDATAEATMEMTAEATAEAVTTNATVNIELVFDSSGSMAAAIGGETRIDAARRAINYIVQTLPEDDPLLNVGFRVFGHEGDNTEANRALSCQSTALVAPLAGVDRALLSEQAALYSPTGWTPITLALTEAARDFPAVDADNPDAVRNVIILVTDGEETCDGDPCAAALALAEADAGIVAHVVGFGLEPGVADTLRCIADNSGGLYFDAADGDALAGVLLSLIGAETSRAGFDFYANLPAAQFPELFAIPFRPIPFPDFPGMAFPLPEGFTPEGFMPEGFVPTPAAFSFPTVGAPAFSFPSIGGAEATATASAP